MPGISYDAPTKSFKGKRLTPLYPMKARKVSVNVAPSQVIAR